MGKTFYLQEEKDEIVVSGISKRRGADGEGEEQTSYIYSQAVL